jgi:hypothetical protein
MRFGGSMKHCGGLQFIGTFAADNLEFDERGALPIFYKVVPVSFRLLW